MGGEEGDGESDGDRRKGTERRKQRQKTEETENPEKREAETREERQGQVRETDKTDSRRPRKRAGRERTDQEKSERESGRVGWGERRRGGFHRAQAGGCQSRSIAHTVPRACPASASPECVHLLASTVQLMQGSQHAKHKRDGAVGGRGLTGSGAPGRARGLALPPDGTDDPGREKREGGHLKAGASSSPADQAPGAWGVGEGMEGGTRHTDGGRAGQLNSKLNRRKGRKTNKKQNPQMSLDTKIKNNV